MDQKEKDTAQKYNKQEYISYVKDLEEKALKGKGKVFRTVGRRKRAIARVWLYPSKGEFLVNGDPIDDIYTDEYSRTIWVKPFHTVGVAHPKSKFADTVKVSGGGVNAQLEAIQLAIARALVLVDADNKSPLRKAGLVTRDPREVERKKTSQPGARKKVQYSKR